MSIDDETRHQFGKRLERVMLQRGYQVASLSAASSLSRFILERWLAGDGMPTKTSIVRLARALRVRESDLTGEKPELHKTPDN